MSDQRPPAPPTSADLGVYTPEFLVWAYEHQTDEEFQKSYSHPRSFVREHYDNAVASLVMKAKREAKLKALQELEAEDGIMPEPKTSRPKTQSAAVADIEPAPDLSVANPDRPNPSVPAKKAAKKTAKKAAKKAAKRKD